MLKSKNLFIGIVGLIIVVILVFFMLIKDNSQLISSQEFHALLEKNKPKSLMIDSNYIYLNIDSKNYKVARIGSDLADLSGFPIKIKKNINFGEVVGNLGIFILIIIGIAVFLRAFNLMMKKNSPTMKSNYQPSQPFKDILSKNDDFTSIINPMTSSVKFEDVAGIKEVKEELLEIIDYLKNPKRYQDLGITLPKGVLLVGPPGVGKTMIAKAVAGEAQTPFFYQSGSSFVQIYVGMGAKRVRELFSKAKANAPSIVFIDEIDAVGKARGNNRNDEREATLNQLLTEMDGFEDSNGVIVIGATNKIDVLDEALLRSGRFDRRIYVGLPDLDERVEILKVYLQNKHHNLDLIEVSKMCVGFSGAAIASLINEAALNALKRNSDCIELKDILDVKDKVVLGKKKLLSFSDKEKNILSIYQSAKAISAYWLDLDFDKVTLVSDFLIDLDKEILSKSEMMNKIKVYLSGMIALELILNEKYTNAQEDIRKAKKIARDICEEYGMASRIITNELDVLDILSSAFKEQKDFLNNSKDLILSLSVKLLEKEKLSKDNIKEMTQNVF